MKKIFVYFILCLMAEGSFAQKNLTLRAHMPFIPRLSNICGYTAGGHEYALVGTADGMSIVEVTNPDSPLLLFNIPGRNSIWREIKTWDHYAYVTTEAGGGLQIVDLSSLPSTMPLYHNYTGDGYIGSNLSNIHALHIDAGYVYLFGTSLQTVILSLLDPWNPTYAGTISTVPYIHDGYVRNNKLYGCHIYDGYFSVLDVTDKTNVLTLATQVTPGHFTHNSWLSDDSKTLFTTDEINNSFLTSYDISNLSDIKELDRIQSNPGSSSVVHNVHITNDYAVTSWYKDGFTITDASRPGNLIQVGNYDTDPDAGPGEDGCWGVYPFFPSGTIVASDMGHGLFVCTPTYKRGCYFEGTVTDSITGSLLESVNITFASDTNIKDISRFDGSFQTGIADSGTYAVQFVKDGWKIKTVNVTLDNGVVNTLNVKLYRGGLGIDELSKSGVRLAQNPFKDYTEIISATAFEYEILSLSGQLLKKEIVNNNSAEIGSELSAGTYLVKVYKKGEDVKTLKILKTE